VFGERVRSLVEGFQNVRLVEGFQNVQEVTFSRDFKQGLFERNATCHICWKPIESVDDATLAHIPDFWRNNQQLPQNARLDHRFCHKSR